MALDSPGYVQTEVVIQPAPTHAPAWQPLDAQHAPGCSVTSGGGLPAVVVSEAAQSVPCSSSGSGAAGADDRSLASHVHSMPGGSGSNACGAAAGAVWEVGGGDMDEHSWMRSRSGPALDLASADGWAIQRWLLPQAPHRGLALALAFRAARLGRGAAGCGRAATPAEAGPARLRLAVIGAPIYGVSQGGGSLLCMPHCGMPPGAGKGCDQDVPWCWERCSGACNACNEQLRPVSYW